MDRPPLHFIDEEIEVFFDVPPVMQKKPGCPSGFIWRGETYRILESLSEWHDFGRRGRYGRNMRPTHLTRSWVTGSWGVGRFFFQVRVEDDRVFDIYYDRAPANAMQGKGSWHLYSERES